LLEGGGFAFGFGEMGHHKRWIFYSLTLLISLLYDLKDEGEKIGSRAT
jgi:hypothetical protein